MSSLPHINAVFNAASAFFLVAGYVFIRKRRREAHRNCLLAALSASIFFLAGYITYHIAHGTTHFTGQGIARPLYFFVLTTHTLLAVAVIPFVAVTIGRAWRSDFERHRRVARWTFPLWLYVSVTGVAVYVMLYHLYAPQ